MDEHTLTQIRRVGDTMLKDNGVGAFSVAERIAGAFVNGRADWLPDRYKNIGEALVRLGSEWRESVAEVLTRNCNGRW